MVSLIFKRFGMAFVLAAICAILSVLSPAFLNSSNLLNITLQVSITSIVAVGMTFVILTGGIDLSVGSLVALSAVCAGTLIQSGWGMAAGLACALAVGMFSGGVNGLLVAKLKVPPFIATLGMMSAARGLALMTTDGKSLHQFPAAFRFLGNGQLGPIPVPVIIALLTVMLAHYALTQTPFGRYVYAVGGNREATRLSGIRVERIEMAVFAISGLCCGLGAIILMGRLNSAQPIAGYGYELSAIAAVVIGGSSLMGGVGTVVGTLLGALLMGVLQNGLTLLNVAGYVQQIVIGGVIVAAVIVDQIRQGKLGIQFGFRRQL